MPGSSTVNKLLCNLFFECTTKRRSGASKSNNENVLLTNNGCVTRFKLVRISGSSDTLFSLHMDYPFCFLFFNGWSFQKFATYIFYGQKAERRYEFQLVT